MKNFLIVPNGSKDKDFIVSKNVVSYLLSKGASLFADFAFKDAFSDKVSYIDPCDATVDLDCMIVIGGDGSVLDAAPCAMARDIPLLCINMGRLGYLSEVPSDSLELLDNLFNGKYKVSSRMTLDVKFTTKDGEIKAERKALNDVVVSRGRTLQISDLELSDGITDSIVYRVDGIILATPTGSTAYSLSAGGPVVDSSLEAICVTPVSAHSFFNRSILFAPDLNVSVKHISGHERVLYVNIDAVDMYPFHYGDIVTVTKSEKSLKLISLENTGILGTLHKKMKI
jgi:NAD+ kinase